MKDVYEEGIEELRINLQELYDTYAAENEQRIEDESKRTYSSCLKEYEDSLQQLELPGALQSSYCTNMQCSRHESIGEEKQWIALRHQTEIRNSTAKI